MSAISIRSVRAVVPLVAREPTVIADRLGRTWIQQKIGQTPDWGSKQKEPFIKVNMANPAQAPWNKGKLVAQKTPLKLKEIWAIGTSVMRWTMPLESENGRCDAQSGRNNADIRTGVSEMCPTDLPGSSNAC